MTPVDLWKNANLQYLSSVRKALSEPMPDAEEALIGHIRNIEAHYARVGSLLAEANGLLDRGTYEFMSSEAAKKLGTVRERDIAAEGELSPVREIRDKIEALLRAIELRVHLSQSILRQQRGERKLS